MAKPLDFSKALSRFKRRPRIDNVWQAAIVALGDLLEPEAEPPPVRGVRGRRSMERHQSRICFVWHRGEAEGVEIGDYHSSTVYQRDVRCRSRVAANGAPYISLTHVTNQAQDDDDTAVLDASAG